MQPELIEKISAAVHDAWMATKQAQGVTSRKSETGEELLVPYGQLSDAAKDLDRGSVKAVLAGIEAAGLKIGPAHQRDTVRYEDGDLMKPVPYKPAE